MVCVHVSGVVWPDVCVSRIQDECCLKNLTGISLKHSKILFESRVNVEMVLEFFVICWVIFERTGKTVGGSRTFVSGSYVMILQGKQNDFSFCKEWEMPMDLDVLLRNG